ncbi:MAG: phosphatidylserine decarboxylase [Burkholderiales bacterium]|nr:phosphatidylserine decarboxylase [Burkholderiales bacterium]MBP6675530.1 phosphatidylserine decarboxylase [Vitreoscilla sp.]
MNPRTWRDRLLQQEDLNFLLTNRIPRIAATRFMGWFSQIRHPWVCKLSIAIWRLFTELDLSEAKPQRYASLHECFTRELKAGARPFDGNPQVLASPCDGIVGACGPMQGLDVWQAKGYPYRVEELFGHAAMAEPFRDGCFVTLRLTSAMYHRFHAPHNAVLRHVTHIAGDTWNVNPIALKRVARLFCKNERAALHATLSESGHPIALVPVAAVLVASLRLHFLDLLLHGRYPGPHELPCNAEVAKGQELGWFQHGSTVIVFAPAGFTLAPGLATGTRIKAGQPLMHLPQSQPSLLKGTP